MARRNAAGQFLATRPRTGGGGGRSTVVVRVPGSAARARRYARIAGGAAARAAQAEKHTLTALVAAAALGLAERQDVELPHVTTLGVAGTYGALAWVAGRFMRSRMLSHAATGMLSIAVYDFVRDSDDDDDDEATHSGGRRRRAGRRSMGGTVGEDEG